MIRIEGRLNNSTRDINREIRSSADPEYIAQLRVLKHPDLVGHLRMQTSEAGVMKLFERFKITDRRLMVVALQKAMVLYETTLSHAPVAPDEELSLEIDLFLNGMWRFMSKYKVPKRIIRQYLENQRT